MRPRGYPGARRKPPSVVVMLLGLAGGGEEIVARIVVGKRSGTESGHRTGS